MTGTPACRGERAVRKASERLGVDAQLIEGRMAVLTQNGQIEQKIVNGTPAVFDKGAYFAESDVARRLYMLSKDEPRIKIKDPIAAYERYIGNVELSEEQERAVLAALGGQVEVITGGPGHRKDDHNKSYYQHIRDERHRDCALCADGQGSKEDRAVHRAGCKNHPPAARIRQGAWTKTTSERRHGSYVTRKTPWRRRP